MKKETLDERFERINRISLYRQELWLTPDEMKDIYRVGTNKIYEILNVQQPYEIVRVGQRIFVNSKSFFDWYDQGGV